MISVFCFSAARHNRGRGRKDVVVAADFGPMPQESHSYPQGIVENSPTFQRWVREFRAAQVPKGRLKSPDPSAVPSGLILLRALVPTLKRWPIFAGPSGTASTFDLRFTIYDLRFLFLFAALLFFVVAAPAADQPAALPSKTFLITGHGAVGDGKTLNTISIRQAIDHCAAAGGGVVVVPKGTFITGSIFLKQGVNLHLDASAVLK